VGTCWKNCCNIYGWFLIIWTWNFHVNSICDQNDNANSIVESLVRWTLEHVGKYYNIHMAGLWSFELEASILALLCVQNDNADSIEECLIRWTLEHVGKVLQHTYGWFMIIWSWSFHFSSTLWSKWQC
jgi:hypothetical protein